jgi:hypothetical protein
VDFPIALLEKRGVGPKRHQLWFPLRDESVVLADAASEQHYAVIQVSGLQTEWPGRSFFEAVQTGNAILLQ